MRPLNISKRIDYIRKLFAPEDQLLKQVSQRLVEYNMPIHVGAEEGKFLQLLIKMIDAKNIVEVGTLAGYSTIWMARALPENGHIYTIEKSDERLKLAQESFAKCEIGDKITLIHGDALQKLCELENIAPFDMIFIDADKINYNNYLDWAEKNIRKGGLIIGDNSFLFDSVYEENPPDSIRKTPHKVMKEFNQRLSNPDKYMSIMIPTKEGMTIAIKL